MKKSVFSVLLVAFLLGSSSLLFSQDETVLTVNGKPISKGEFERIYKKNNLIDQESSQKSVDEYLQLFVNFKLKVAEAESLGMDTAAAFIQELAGYRKQLAKPYLVNKEVDEQLLREAYERMQWDIHAAHILIAINDENNPEDTLKAYQEALRLRNKVVKGEAFETVAKEFSSDQSAKKNNGDLGYFTAFQMVYPFETAAFTTQPGEISMPVRTRFGYHIIKVMDKRPAVGTVKVAHIMIGSNDSQTPEEINKAYAKILNIYNQLKGGASFKDLAERFSEDKSSAVKAGELPEFGTGRMVPDFEKVAFSLKNPNDLSEPFKSPFGFHIIKLIEKKGIGSFDELKNDLKSKIQRDERANKSKEVFLAQLKTQYTIVEPKKALDQFIRSLPDTLLNGKWDGQLASNPTAVLITISGQNFTAQEFAKWLAKATTPKTKIASSKEYITNEYHNWMNQCLMDLEDKNLEKKYPDFRYLMSEYHDGILLFDLSDKLIWSKAVKDTAGLVEFYSKSDKKYYWEERAECYFYQLHEKNDTASTLSKEKLALNNQKALEKLRKLAEKRSKKPVSNEIFIAKANKLIQKSKSNYEISILEKLLEKEANPMLKQVSWTPGLSQIFDNAGELVFIQIKSIKPKTEKTLQEVKGLVTADYQTYLEQKWIEELKQKYEVHVDKKVLETIR